VDEKSRIKDIPEATLVDLLFACVLFVFKLWSKIPMSTTWCFVGLLAGRELSLAVRKAGITCKQAAWMSGKDLLSVTAGFLISLAVGAGGNPYVREGIYNTFYGPE
jgi:phosphate/sulfate permease